MPESSSSGHQRMLPVCMDLRLRSLNGPATVLRAYRNTFRPDIFDIGDTQEVEDRT